MRDIVMAFALGERLLFRLAHGDGGYCVVEKVGCEGGPAGFVGDVATPYIQVISTSFLLSPTSLLTHPLSLLALSSS